MKIVKYAIAAGLATFLAGCATTPNVSHENMTLDEYSTLHDDGGTYHARPTKEMWKCQATAVKSDGHTVDGTGIDHDRRMAESSAIYGCVDRGGKEASCKAALQCAQ